MSARFASAVGGRSVSLSHVGSVFPVNAENLRRWRGWWRYILTDQAFVWAPGCFMGMALPALLSMQFAQNSPMFGRDVTYSQPLIVADGMLHTPQLGASGVAVIDCLPRGRLDGVAAKPDVDCR